MHTIATMHHTGQIGLKNYCTTTKMAEQFMENGIISVFSC